MTYSKLLLSSGGGIISQTQQADQVDNTATLLIGLGGTGVDCLTEIKKAVRERLKPDDPTALVPTYDHIRFLAVDTDLENSGFGFFDSSECFDIANSDIKGALKKKSAISARREMDWLDSDKINAADIGDAGAGGFRQAGRYMLMDQSNAFLDKIKSMIRSAKMNAGKASLYVHIFSGLGGGTGSGTFLDACYLIRKAIAEENGGAGIMLGYFFLPDVNLSKIPESATLVRDYVPRNGYAAMQELDYCMRLGENGGGFTQIYKGGKAIDWKEAPVDMCHLICATDKSRQVVENAYQNAMLVTTEYVMDFLTKPMDDAAEKEETGVAAATASKGESKFALKSHLANFTAQVMAANERKEKGYNLAYCVIGASCASIPMRKINTYLAAKVFEAFSVVADRTPTENEVQKLAEKAKIASIDNLLIEINKNAGSDLAIAPDYLDWTFVRDNGDRDLVEWYTNQQAERVGALEKNAKSMMDEGNSASLIARVCEQIDACAKDLGRGPAYAYRTLQAAQKGNMLNIVDGLIENINKRISQMEYNVYTQPQSRKAVYENTKNIWYADKNKRWPASPKNAFNDYVYAIEDYVKGMIELTGMEKLKAVLEELRKQLSRKADGYYLKFSRVMSNLISTFAENLNSLNEETVKGNQGMFAIPLVQIDEIKPTLDAEVLRMDMPGLLHQFVSAFFQDEKSWIDEDENKISKLVKDFFIKTTFSEFADRSITQFLADKYNTQSNQEISNRLYKEYMTKLKDRSQALFPVDGSVWDDAITSEIAYVSVPSTAEVVINAAETLYAQDNAFGIKKSALKDRIYIMRCSVALPIGAYANVELYEQAYFSGEQSGRHFYIGKGGSELFNDWQKLPSLIPQSLIEGHTPHKLQTIIDEAGDVYEKAKTTGLLNGDTIRHLSDKSLQAIEAGKQYVAAAELKAAGNAAQGVLIMKDALAKLNGILSALEFADTNYHLPKGSVITPEIEETIRKDYFVSSPAFHSLVRADVAIIDEIKAKANELQKKVDELEGGDKMIKGFAQALFAGVIVWDKLKVTYTKYEFGIPTEVALSDFMQRDKFKYALMPLYQAYVSYQALDEDTRADITKEADQKIAAFDDAFITSVKGYMARFTPEFNTKFVESAKATPEILQDATNFIRSMNVELKSLGATIEALGL